MTISEEALQTFGDQNMVITAPVSNHSLYSLRSDTERYVLVGWSSLALCTNLLGNTTVLLATIRYRAIRLDKVSVTLIQNIAVSDILMGINTIFPVIVSLIADRWVFGDMLCYIQHYLKIPSIISPELLICAMHISKLTCLVFPLRATQRKKKTARFLAGTLWVLASMISIVQLCVDKYSIAFDYRYFKCTYVYRAATWKWARPLLFTTIMVLPNIIVCVTTMALLIFILKRRRALNLQGALTSLYVGLAYVLAFGPISIKLSIIQNLYPNLDQNIYGLAFTRFAFFISFLNGMANVFIYMVSVKSFGEFMKKSVLRTLQTRWGRLVTATYGRSHGPSSA